MSESIFLASARLSAHVHSTENMKKVRSALARLIPAVDDELKGLLTTTTVGGDYGNQIYVLTALLRGKKRLETFLENLKQQLDASQKESIKIATRTSFNPESSTLFLRFHKQVLYQGEFCLTRSDDIVHVALKFSSHGSGHGDRGARDDIEQKNQIVAFLQEHGIID